MRGVIGNEEKIVSPPSQYYVYLWGYIYSGQARFILIKNPHKYKSMEGKSTKKEEKPQKNERPKALISSYDLIGDIAIMEIPENREKEAKKIAKSIMLTHPRVKTVMQKLGEREGEYRLRELKLVIGKETFTEHRESGCIFPLDVTETYFSPREGTERERIASLIKPNETFLVMFAGIGPFAIVACKKQPNMKKVYAVEINPEAVKWMKEGIRKNKLQGMIEPILGDAKTECIKLYGKCSRIVMPLPHEGREFLSTAIQCTKRGGIIHFYYIGHQDDMFSLAMGLIKMECDKLGRKCKILNKHKVLPYGPRIYKICIDFEVC